MTTVYHLNDGNLSYFKFPYNAGFNEEIRGIIPPKDRDTTNGLGWQPEDKLWVFPQQHHIAVEDLLGRVFGRIFWKECNTYEQIAEASP